MQKLRSAGLARAVDVAAVANEWGADDNVTLRELTMQAKDATWREILESHLTAMTELTREIQELRDLNVQYLRVAIRSTQEALADDGSAGGIYDARGLANSAPSTARIFDLNL